jgi:hypothetical protein
MKKFLALLFGRLVPLGMTGAFLQTSYSPIRPALNAFRAATSALSGEAVNNSGAGGLVPTGDARMQLDQIIADVKAKGGSGLVTPPGSPPHRQAPQPPKHR